ncbi:MAG: hypothetical protein DKINENOH_02871 [bacterium]|nr:hypothetical protein [bacterium]
MPEFSPRKHRSNMETFARARQEFTLGMLVMLLCTSTLPAQTIPNEIRVSPRVSTGAVSGDADDPAIWIHPTEPEQSLVIGTDKVGGAVYVWDMNGQQRQRIPISSYPNNGDVRYGMPVSGVPVDIYVVGAESPSRLVIFKIDPSTRQLSDITASGATSTPQVKDPYGVCLYRRASDGAMYAFVNSNGGVNGVLNQYQLLDNGSGRVRAEFVRSFGGDVNGNHSEGMVADDELGYVYISEEDCCIHKFYADPDMGNQQLAEFAHSDGIDPDREGLGLYGCADGTGYILLSSQGNKRVKVYRREGDPGNPHSHTLVTTIYTPDAGGTDGLDVTNQPAGTNFPHGFLAKHNGDGKNFMLYAWEDIAQNYLTTCSIVSDFTATVTSGCAPLSVTFTDLSTGPVTAWEWNFGDSTTSTEQHPTHTYNSGGVYTVTLTTTNASGYRHTSSRANYIAVGSAPIAAFTAEPTTGFPPLAVTFTDQSTGHVSEWRWDFGDSTTSTLQHPTHEYAKAGIYTVTLTVSDSCGSHSATKTELITVNSPVVADFSVSDTSGCSPLTVQFSDSSTGAPTSWLWDFGDGTTSTDQHPSHTYSAAGSYTVTLTANSAVGSDIETKTAFVVVASAPTAGFQAARTLISVSFPVAFTDQSSSNASSWSWDFGDGSTSTEQNPTHQYATAGQYTVSLTVANECGTHTESKAAYLTVVDTVVASFSAGDTAGCAPLAVQFTEQSSGPVTSWLWNFGDGTTSTEPNPAHTYADTGSYRVTLTVWNAAQDSSAAAQPALVRVYPLPQAAFTANVTSGNAPVLVQFTDQSAGSPASWLWDFGDGGSSTEQHPAHTYIAAGEYTVVLTITNACSSNTITQANYIHIDPCIAPVPDFSAADTSGSVPLPVRFGDRSTGAPAVWLWDFGDGNTSSEQNPTHQYLTSGEYTVTLTVSNDCDTNTVSKQSYVTVVDTVSAKFSAEAVSGCAPVTVQFSDQSTGPVISWLWDFGDSTTASEQHPAHTYTAAGKYTVKLTVKNAAGWSSTEVKTEFITISALPKAAFAASVPAGETPLTVTFTDQSTGFPAPATWQWDFGDGNTSTEQHPTHTYTAVGNYTVQLQVTNTCGESTETKADHIRVRACTPPLAKFAGTPVLGSVPLQVSFTDSSTGNPTSWSWDFGDGNTATEQHPSHQYLTPGEYTVTLQVANGCDTSAVSRQNYVTVVDTVAAAFSADVTAGCAPLAVQFTDQSTGPVISWLWDFGDGTTSSEQSPSHSFTSAGEYTVKLKVTNAAAWSNTETKSEYIVVSPELAAAFVAAPTSGNAPVVVNFTDQSSGDSLTWSWDFGDGSSSTEQNPVHTYTAAGDYAVSLIVTNGCGTATEIKTTYVHIDPCIAPTASFTASPTSGGTPLTVTFTDQSHGDSLTWHWDFGDGQTSAEQHPVHTYTAAGDFTVRLVVTNDCRADTSVQTNLIHVEPCTPPAAAFAATPVTGSVPLTVSFTDQSAGEPTAWSWRFGDGTTSTQQNPTHVFAAAGTYSVSLTATSACDSNTATKQNFITVADTVVAQFTAQTTSGCAPLAVQFTDQSTGPAASWLWDLGDGSTSAEPNPLHTYANAGTYHVKLTVSNGAGQSRTETKNNYITVSAAPVAAFTAAPVSGNVPLTVAFTDQSTGGPASWSWDFGDGNSSNAQNPTHTYATAGDYTVQLTVANACGQTAATQTNLIQVKSCPPLTADFSASATSGNAPLLVNFTDRTTGNPTSWLWDFGDGSSVAEQNPSHQYAAPGTYTVTLTATDACTSDTEVKTGYISVNSVPTGNLAVGKIVMASGTTSPYAVERAVDGTTTTYWRSLATSKSTPNTWLSADLGAAYHLDRAVVRWKENYYAVRYRFQISSSGGSNDSEWTTVYTNTAGRSGAQDVTFTSPFAARYFRIRMDQNNKDNNQIFELECYASSPCLPPSVNFVATATSGVAPFTVNFTDQSGGNPTSWNWDFGDGTSSTERNPSHTYSTPGDYTVRLTTGNTCGTNTGSKANYIHVEPCLPPAVNFTAATTSGNAPLTVNFTDQSTGNPTSWSWNFGDGSTATPQNPSHQYTAAGDYTVTLTATSSCGTATKSQTNYIHVDPCLRPTVNFTASTTSGNAPLTVNFIDQSTGSPSVWRWEFGDDSTSTLQNPSHQYTVAGDYTVTLTVTSSCGATTKSQTNFIHVDACLPPVANFTALPDSGNAPLAVKFTDQSTGSPSSWHWDFGDGNTATQQNPTHTYSAAGDYTVKLIITNICGADTLMAAQRVHVDPCLLPAASFTAATTSGNAPVTVKFTDQSAGSPHAWRWEFGDDSTSTQQNPSHTYQVAGDYTVKLIATNACGSDTAIRENYIRVNPCVPPTANFSASATSGNAPLSVSFRDESSGNPTSWSWEFGDGTSSTEQSPSHQYTLAGTYTVKLTATSACNFDTETKIDYITVNSVPTGNLARGKLATAASTTSPYGTERAVDGSATSYWRSGASSKAAPNLWLRVDLEGPYYLSRAVVKWKENYYASRYRFEISNTGGSSDSEWTTVYTNNAGTAGTQDVTFTSPFAARYFRIRMVQNIKDNNQIFELECYAGSAKQSAGDFAAAVLPEHFELKQNYPNPFNPTTTITFDLATRSEVGLTVYNTAGQLVKKLASGTFGRGRHQIIWDANDTRGVRVTSGVYLFVLQTDGFVAKRKLVLAK